jgi:Tetracyclin repressor-like, C-terminal domain
MRELSVAQKRNRLRDRVAIEQHQGMRRLQHDMIGHTFELCAGNGHPAVVRAQHDKEGGDGIERSIAGDDADLVIRRQVGNEDGRCWRPIMASNNRLKNSCMGVSSRQMIQRAKGNRHQRREKRGECVGICLAAGYLAFATENANLLRSLFEHRMEHDRPFPEDILNMVMDAFALMYPPLFRLLPDRDPAEVALIARTMFSAVHGIISLGLEERMVAMPPEKLRQQLTQFVDAQLTGLGAREERR